MKTKNALKKIIFTGFALIVVFLSVFSFYVSSYAYTYFLLNNTGSNANTIQTSGTFLFKSASNVSFYYGSGNIPVLICLVKDSSNLYYRYFFSNTSLAPFYSFRDDTYRVTQYNISSFDSTYNVYFNSGLLAQTPDITVNPLIPCFSTTDEAFDYASSFYFPTPTPDPTPTPTPEPTLTPAPTFNPYAPTYTTFFERLTNDANSALNALYLGWQQANNKFYTGIFFIGIPVLLGIFGLVASIFFGGGSDD